MASPFKGSDHIKPPDYEGPSNGDCLESGRRHMALVCKKLATGAFMDQVLSVRPGRRPIKTCTERLANKGPSRGVVTAETGMNFGQELPPLFLGDTSLKYSGSTFLVELSVVNLVGLRTPDNAASLILVFGKLLPINVGQEGFSPWGNDCHDEMCRRCYFGG